MKSIFTTLCLITCLLFHYHAKAYSQGITLTVKDATLDKVFGMIQKQTNLIFVYSGKQLASARKVSLDVKNEKFEKVMEMVMAGQPLRYTVDKEYVIIQIKGSNTQVLPDSSKDEERPIELTGRVMNEKGEPVAGATITVKGSGITIASGIDGYFTFKSVDNKAVLTVSSIGYEPKVVRLSGSNSIEIKLILFCQIRKNSDLLTNLLSGGCLVRI